VSAPFFGDFRQLSPKVLAILTNFRQIFSNIDVFENKLLYFDTKNANIFANLLRQIYLQNDDIGLLGRLPVFLQFLRVDENCNDFRVAGHDRPNDSKNRSTEIPGSIQRKFTIVFLHFGPASIYMSILNNTEDRTPGELIITLVTIQQNNVD
jgi:hypothetical protein